MDYLLIGAGQVGSRHLQSLASLPDACTVYAVEPSPAAREVAQQRWEQVEKHRNKKIIWSELASLPKGSIAAAVISTPAAGRVALIEAALSLGVRDLLCEKVLFQSVAEYKQALSLIREHGARAYVNHVARYIPLYGTMKRELQKSGDTLQVEAQSGHFGMACNLIHYLDLLEFITGEHITTLDITIDRPLLPCKRGPQFVEFTGTAKATTARGDSLTITSVEREPMLPRFEFRYGNSHIIVDENSSTWEEAGKSHDLEVPFVSGTTARILQEIRDGKTLLPTLEESFTLNQLMLDAFNHALHEIYDDSTLCPIT